MRMTTAGITGRTGWGGRILALLVALTLPHGAAAAESPPRDYVAIATGPVDGVYYPVGRALCARMIAATAARIHCAALPSPGSSANLDLMRSGEAQMAIIQGDIPGYSELVIRDLGVVAGLHEEYLTVVAPPDPRIREIHALPPRLLRSGPMGSGHRITAIILATALGVRAPDPVTLSGRHMAASEFCADDDPVALLLMTGHPAGNVQELMLNCAARLVPLDSFTITRIRQRDPAYRAAVIPAGTYRGQERPVATVSRQALLVARRDIPPALVRAVMDAVLEDFEAFTASHPALADLTPLDFTSPRSRAPRHPAAVAKVTMQGQGE